MKTQPQSPACVLVGALKAPDRRSLGGPFVVRVTRLQDGREICRAPVDGAGRFVVKEVQSGDLVGQAIEVAALHLPSGQVRGRQISAFPGRGQVQGLSIQVAYPDERVARRIPPAAKPSPRAPWEVVSARWRVAVAVRLPPRDGRPQAPRRINQSISELTLAAQLARTILGGDFRAAERFLGVISRRDLDAPPGASFRAMSKASQAGGLGDALPRARFFGGGPDGGLPCLFDGGPAAGVALAGLYLDIYRADQLGDLTQPGAYATLAAQFLYQRFDELNSFGRMVLDYHQGDVTAEMYAAQVYGGAGEAEPLLLPERWQEATWGRTPELRQRARVRRLSLPGEPGALPAPPCDWWLDCVDEIVTAAVSYRPPAHCDDEAVIGSVTPSAICQGAREVELELRPVHGQKFNGVCHVFLKRERRAAVGLELISFSDEVIRVRLARAEFSGCLGFHGGGHGASGNIGFLTSCFRGVLGAEIIQFMATGGAPLQIECTGRNKLTVVPPPVLSALSALGLGGYSSPLQDGATYLAEEGCTPVILIWRFDFGGQDAWVDPDEHLRVRVTRSDGSVVAEGLGPEDSVTVTDRDDEIYTVHAVARAGEHECGSVEGTITVDRYLALHLEGPEALQVGHSGAVQVRNSCPAPAGGLDVTLSVDQPGRLQVPGKVNLPEGQATATVQVVALGTGCDQVQVSAQAADHVGGAWTVAVFDRPEIAAISPTAVAACQSFELDFSGACFYPGDTVVRAAKAGESQQTLEILEITPTSLRCGGQGLKPGSWAVTVVSRGLASAAALLDVQAAAPTITYFLACVVRPEEDPSLTWCYPLVPCADNWVKIRWSVQAAARVVIKRDQEDLYTVDLPECGGSSEDWISDILTGAATYTLEALPVGGGNPVVASSAIEAAGYSSVTLVNQSDRALVIWKIEGVYQDAADIPGASPKYDLATDGQLNLDLEGCALYHLIAIDKETAIAAGHDPYGDAVEVANLRRWEAAVYGWDEGDELTTSIW